MPEEMEVVAVASPTKRNAADFARRHGIPRSYSDYREMLNDPAVELISITAPNRLHAQVTIDAARAGKHVVCEKPAAQSAGGIRRMIAAAKKADRLLTMHHNYRLNPEFLYVREVMQSGVLGKVFRIKRRAQSFARRNDWQVLRKYGGGMTGNWGIHLVDACLQLLDAPVRDVWGDVKQVFNPGDAEDDIKALIRAESGMTVDIDMTAVNAAPEPSWVIMGDHGTLWITGHTAHLKYFNPKQLPRLKVNDLHYVIDRRYGVVPGPDEIPWQQREEEVKPRKQYASYYDNLFEAVRKGKKLLVEPDSALETYRVLDLIRKGSRFAPGQ
jgi:predicted dehydrogenase